MKNPDAPETLSDDELQESLTRDHAWQFEGPFYTEVPSPKPEYVKGIQSEVERLQNHLLKTVIIRDHFDEDHDGRQAFLTENQLGEFVKKRNKLEGNNLLVTILFMHKIMRRIQRKFPDLHTALTAVFTNEIIEPFDRYNEMEFNEKVTYARKLDEAIYRFLEILSQ